METALGREASASRLRDDPRQASRCREERNETGLKGMIQVGFSREEAARRLQVLGEFRVPAAMLMIDQVAIREAPEMAIPRFMKLARAVLDEESRSRPFYYAVLISSALLYVLNRLRANYSVDALRVMADAAMLVPLPVFIALSANS